MKDHVCRQAKRIHYFLRGMLVAPFEIEEFVDFCEFVDELHAEGLNDEQIWHALLDAY